MKTSMTPKTMAIYRAAKQIVVGGQRVCTGQCKRRRSIAQFDGDSTACKICVRQGRV